MLKLSGEALQGKLGFGVDPEVLRSVARDIAECQMRGVQVSAHLQPVAGHRLCHFHLPPIFL